VADLQPTKSAGNPNELNSVKVSDLDKNWQELMFLCNKEEEYARDATHPKLLAHIRRQIEKLAADMGFNPAQIRSRQFRAERDGQHITRILTDD
jgi:hypothetical protein